MIIGITGSIGSGKTTVAKLFSKHHYNRIDADEIAHGLIKKNSVIYKKIIDDFGNKIMDKQKNIDRKKLGNIVFNDEMKLKKLNPIMHLEIIKGVKNQTKKIQNKCGNNTKIIIDTPLLFETRMEDFFDKIIVVKINKQKIIQRNKKFSKQQIENILKNQMPLEEKIKKADFVIDNSKDFKHLEKQVNQIIRKIESQ